MGLLQDMLGHARPVPPNRFVLNKFQAELLRRHYGWKKDPPWLVVAPDLPAEIQNLAETENE